MTLDASLIKLIEAVRIQGPRNCSALSKLTGIPVETIRYRLKNMFVNRGLVIHLQIHHAKLGLARVWAHLSFKKDFIEYSTQVMRTLAEKGFLTFFGYSLPNRDYISLFAVPFKHVRGLAEVFSTLKEYGILNDFSLRKMDWMKIFSTNPRYFNFKDGKWHIDWSNLYPNPGILEDCSPLHTDTKIDDLDILIIKELQKDPMQSLSSIAKTLGVDPKVARYHYTNHILKNNIILGYIVHWHSHIDTCINHRFASIAVKVTDLALKDIYPLLQAFERIPFINFVAFSKEKDTLLAYALMPSSHYMDTLFYIVHHVLSPKMNYDIHTIDVTSSKVYSIPYEHFSNGKWVFNKYTILESILECVEEVTKIRGGWINHNSGV